jgi:murein DD-endopeptidase MepM/ murein hydrolase activator NlpD
MEAKIALFKKINMWKKLTLLWVTTLGLVWGFQFVSGWNLVFNPEVSFVTAVSKDVYLDGEGLNTTILVYKSNVDLTNAIITSLCNISSQYVADSKWLYFFSVDYSQASDCNNWNVVLSLWEDDYANTIHQLNLVKDIDLYSIYLDYSSEKLKEYQKMLDSDMQKYAIYKNFDAKNIIKYYQFLVGQRKYNNASYRNTLINSILVAREEKYASPVPGYGLSTIPNRVPNAWRPYRDSYTDGIHHGWDIYTKFWDEVAALDDGIIVRVVEDFDDSDFSRIVYWDDLSLEQELKNLDILRGKQVWLKTMKWEVVFYSHLNFVEWDVKEWEMVKRGKILWTVGISGVPEKWYDDYHLHFSVMENPYNYLEAGTYDFGDYMAWDWLTRHETYDEVIKQQKTIFE